MHKMLSFGFSHKVDRYKHQAVGQYGNGFKSGSMRLGKDAIVFSFKNKTKTVGFLSQTFLEKVEATTVLVPIVSWTLDNQIIQSEEDADSLEAILQHSIFKTQAELFEQFEKIDIQKGTRIIIYNLKRDVSNRLEFDFMKESQDIIIAEEYDLTHPEVIVVEPDNKNKSDIPEHTYSLRAFCSILYMKPKLRIYLRGKRVALFEVEKKLRDTERYTYRPKNFKPAPEPANILFGFNPKKNQYGMMMYHKNRLIKPYVKVGYQLKVSEPIWHDDVP
ncbi:MORC family CW-type zinc finger protein 3-like [Amphiura filiformis]|uniref:MORC family CW-type zinc finger protein 3-like n=1 Tax=Amphiura filiformis TaxID=82378 RepID=UPI003B2270A2